MTAAPTRLVVEDEWLARNYLVELLQGTGLAEVVAAVATLAEAEQALDATAAVGIDAAFVDVQLAGRPGDDSGLDWVRENGRVAPRVSCSQRRRSNTRSRPSPLASPTIS